MPFADLPGRGERLAPSFGGGAKELGCYFAELEALYPLHAVITDVNRKQGALKYLATAALERTWRASNTFTDATKTFDKFKQEIHEFYPGSSNDVFTFHHLDVLIGKHVHLSIQNATKLGDFHLQFMTISKYLINKSRMSQAEQMQGFLHMLQPELENKVKQPLQITQLQHNPQDPYKLRDLYEAAGYCLLGSAPAGSLSVIRGATLLSPPSPLANIKTKLQNEVQSAIKLAMAEMTEMFKSTFAAQAQFSGGGQASQSHACMPTMTQLPTDQSSKCNFCSEAGHFMCKCKVVNEYACIGKCKHNHKNKIVLPSGATVPCSIVSTWLHDCIDEYHR